MSLTNTEGYNLVRQALPCGSQLKTWSCHDLICCAEEMNSILAEGQRDFLLVTRKYDKEDFISGIDLVVQQTELHQFSWTCKDQVDFRSRVTNEVRFYTPKGEVTLEQALALAEVWDSTAKWIEHPDNKGKHVVVDWTDAYTKAAWSACLRHARDTGSMESFSKCITSLANKPNRQSRVILWPYSSGDEMFFEIQRVDMYGNWKRLMVGGLVYHRSSNEWSTHT